MMKKIALLLVSMVTLSMFASCDNVEGDYAAYSSFVTVRTSTATPFFFEMDNGKTAFPGDMSRKPGYEAKDGQRAMIWFNFLEQPVQGFDYNVAIYQIAHIFTSKPQFMTKAEFADMPNDGIDMLQAQLNKAYLTMHVVYKSSMDHQHDFSLVSLTDATEKPKLPEYLDVELVHNAKGDQGSLFKEDFISFSMDALKTLMEGKKGLNIHVKTITGELRTYQIALK